MSAAPLDPEHEVVRNLPGNASTPTGQSIASREHLPLFLEALEIIAQPRDVVVERRLPVPQARLQLPHGVMLNDRTHSTAAISTGVVG
jgi:hypothetical protein